VIQLAFPSYLPLFSWPRVSLSGAIRWTLNNMSCKWQSDPFYFVVALFFRPRPKGEQHFFIPPFSPFSPPFFFCISAHLSRSVFRWHLTLWHYCHSIRLWSVIIDHWSLGRRVNHLTTSLNILLFCMANNLVYFLWSNLMAGKSAKALKVKP